MPPPPTPPNPRLRLTSHDSKLLTANRINPPLMCRASTATAKLIQTQEVKVVHLSPVISPKADSSVVSVTVKLVAVGKEVPSVTKTVLATRVPDNCLTQPDQLSSSHSFSSHCTSSITAASLIRSFLSRLDQNPSETVFAKFYRVASKNLKQDFYEALDHHASRLIELFKTRKGVAGQSLDRLLQPINTQTNDITTTRTAVLQCLPLYLGDNSSEFFLSYSDSDSACDFTQVPVWVLSIMTED
uniref:uncharacterized protein LOC124064477 n=1 Tax=Scatophagus argus TaxID=75038 RepID=UPI001ED7D2E2|nr:uncharacterized protein LOC124064477 [Scatophagus argus]